MVAVLAPVFQASYYRQAVANLESAENVGQASMFESA
jgi:hypothetical protein